MAYIRKEEVKESNMSDLEQIIKCKDCIAGFNYIADADYIEDVFESNIDVVNKTHFFITVKHCPECGHKIMKGK